MLDREIAAAGPARATPALLPEDCIVGVFTVVFLVGSAVLAVVGLWFIYRLVRGFIRLGEGRSPYEPLKRRSPPAPGARESCVPSANLLI